MTGAQRGMTSLSHSARVKPVYIFSGCKFPISPRLDSRYYSRISINVLIGISSIHGDQRLHFRLAQAGSDVTLV